MTPWHVVSVDSLADRLTAALGNAYLIEREIRGGMSRVFVAADRVLSRRVVIKVLDPHLAAGVSVDRFRREILTAAALQHPHIVGVLSTGEVDGLPFFVMPYVDGESLADLIHRGPLSVRAIVAILKDVARALAFAHERGVVHRDIKPGNILLAGGSAMVTDFGVAKALSASHRSDGDRTLPHTAITTAGTSLGTLLYMAPEQAAADPEIDGRADIYALGITAFEALTGAPPFADLSARQMLTARLSGAVPPLAARRPDVPAALEALIRRCLAADPSGRPQTARELIELLEDPALVTTAAPPAVEPVTPARHHRRRTAMAGIAAAALLAVGGSAAWRAHAGAAALNPPAPPAALPAASAAKLGEVAVLPFVDLGDDSSGASFAAGLTNAVAGSLTKSGRLRVVAPSVAGEILRRAGEQGGRNAIGAAMLLEGTVQRSGGRLRVTARLTNAADGVMRWADVYDRDSANILAVQDEIAAAIVASVSPSSTGSATPQPASAPAIRIPTPRRS